MQLLKQFQVHFMSTLDETNEGKEESASLTLTVTVCMTVDTECSFK